MQPWNPISCIASGRELSSFRGPRLRVYLRRRRSPSTANDGSGCIGLAENEAAILTPATNNCDDISVKRATPTSTRFCSSLMPVDPHPPFNVYRDQITALSQGLALWNPNPPKRIYNNVSIGDVGYLHEGTFIRMFNVMLPWDDPSNRTLGVPEFYEPLDCGPFTNTLEGAFDKVDHYSRNVTAEQNAGNTQALSPEQCVI
jgi:hypothetical protein